MPLLSIQREVLFKLFIFLNVFLSIALHQKVLLLLAEELPICARVTELFAEVFGELPRK